MSHQGKPVSQHFGEDFEGHIKKANRPILLNSYRFCTFWKQNNHTKVEAI
jgi:hypothetical protein